MATTNENVKINFITTADNRGAKSAASQIGMLEKQASKLGKTMIAAFSAQKIVGFLKDSVTAFAQDQRSAALLANTMKNLFMAQDVAKMEAYIGKTEMLTGIMDDQLRPAMEKLLRVTFDAGRAQELMNLALDVSAGTGKDLDTVVLALSKAYGGNMTALGKLGAGLTKADLATTDFMTIQKKLAMLFKGESATAANTFQGKIDRLKVAVDQMKESIGKGMVDALDRVAGSNGIDNLTSAMKGFGEEIGNAIGGLGRLFSFIKDKTPKTAQQKKNQKTITEVLASVFAPQAFAAFAGVDALANYNKQKTAEEAKLNATGALQLALEANAAEKVRLELLRKEREAAAKLKKEANDKLVLEKASNFLRRSERMFDPNAIQLAAALQGNLTDQDRKRVELKQTQLELQNAIADKDAALASKLMASITEQEKGIRGLGTAITDLPDAPDLLKTLKSSAKELEDQYNTLIELQKKLFGATTSSPMPVSTVTPEQLKTGISPYVYENLNQGFSPTYAGNYPPQQNITLNVAGSVVRENDLYSSTAQWLQDYSASGSQFQLNRLNGTSIG